MEGILFSFCVIIVGIEIWALLRIVEFWYKIKGGGLYV